MQMFFFSVVRIKYINVMLPVEVSIKPLQEDISEGN